jgi:hypothetical protein
VLRNQHSIAEVAFGLSTRVRWPACLGFDRSVIAPIRMRTWWPRSPCRRNSIEALWCCEDLMVPKPASQPYFIVCQPSSLNNASPISLPTFLTTSLSAPVVGLSGKASIKLSP